MASPISLPSFQLSRLSLTSDPNIHLGNLSSSCRSPSGISLIGRPQILPLYPLFNSHDSLNSSRVSESINLCCWRCHSSSSDSLGASEDEDGDSNGQWDFPIRQFIRTAAQKFDGFWNPRSDGNGKEDRGKGANERGIQGIGKLVQGKQIGVEVELDVDVDADDWGWERWEKHFKEVEEQEHLISVLKSQLDSAIDKEDFEEAARLKVAITAIATKDTVGHVITLLNRAVEEERYQDAAFVQDNAGAGLVGWWAGISDDRKDPYGCIIRISAEHGRYVARSFSPRQLAASAGGAPLFEIFLTLNKSGEYKQKAVYLKRKIASPSFPPVFPKSSTSLNPLNPSGGKGDLFDPIADDPEDSEDGDDEVSDELSGFRSILQDPAPDMKVKILKVSLPEKVDQDSISKMVDQMMDEDDEDKQIDFDNSDADDGVAGESDKDIDDIDIDISSGSGFMDNEEQNELVMKVVVGGLSHKLSSRMSPKDLLRVPAELKKKGRTAFSFLVEGDDNVEKASDDKSLKKRKARVRSQRSAQRVMSDLAKFINKGEKIPMKVLKDVSELVSSTLTEAQNHQPLSGSTTFNRIELPGYQDPLNGLYIGAHGPYTSEVIQLSRKFGQWKDDRSNNKKDDFELYEYVEAVKITGDPYVPAGQIAFRAKVGKKYQLPHKGIIPEEFGVIARYRGEGRLAEPGYRNPKWVDGELVILDGKYIKSGPVVGFVYWAPEYQFLVFFQRLRLQD